MRHVYESPRVVVPAALQQRLLMLAHRPQCAGHLEGRKLCVNRRWGYYWPAMGPACYLTRRDCVSCAREWAKLRQVTKATNNWWDPILHTNAVESLSSSAIGIRQFPELQSRVENTLAPPKQSIQPSIRGMGYEFLIVLAFNFL